MKKFLITFISFASIGLVGIVILLAGYVYFDPFKILRTGYNFSGSQVVTNRDYISTETFNRDYPKYHYNSFIFGSSRTIAYTPEHWVQYLDSSAAPFVFDASGENLFGIYTKLAYLDTLNVPLNNALIILCRDCAYRPENMRHLFIKHPLTSHKSKLVFNWAFLKAYFDRKFIVNYYAYLLTKQYQDYMDGYISPKKIIYQPVTNALDVAERETEIAQNPALYYQQKADVFYARTGEKVDTLQRLSGENEKLLTGIKAILEKHHTNYKVVLSPLYEQTKFYPADLALLQQLFGNRLYDFSGQNQFTNSVTNFYEASHYRQAVGDSILSIIFKGQ